MGTPEEVSSRRGGVGEQAIVVFQRMEVGFIGRRVVFVSICSKFHRRAVTVSPNPQTLKLTVEMLDVVSSLALMDLRGGGRIGGDYSRTSILNKSTF